MDRKDEASPSGESDKPAERPKTGPAIDGNPSTSGLQPGGTIPGGGPGTGVGSIGTGGGSTGGAGTGNAA